MRILLVHQIYDRRGGAAKLLFGVEKALRDDGDDVAVLATSTDGKLQWQHPHYLIEGYDRARFLGAPPLRRALWAARALYSTIATDAVDRLVREFRPEVAIVLKPEYQLSPAVVRALSEKRVPIVQWHVDYKPWCTAGQFYNLKLREVCTRCAGGNHLHAIRYRCAGGIGLSAFGCASRLLTTSMLRIPSRPDAFIVPTRANAEYLQRVVGLPADRTRVVPHPLEVVDYRPAESAGDGPLLFFGGISPLKGLWTLAEALALLPEERLDVAGLDDLGLSAEFRAFAEKLGVAARISIDTKLRMGPELQERIRSSRLVVIPSAWKDTLEYALLESMALGKAALVSDSGGNGEFVDDGVTGLRFAAGGAPQLAAAIRLALADRDRLHRIGLAARKAVEKKLATPVFLRALRESIEVAQQHASLRGR